MPSRRRNPNSSGSKRRRGAVDATDSGSDSDFVADLMDLSDDDEEFVSDGAEEEAPVRPPPPPPPRRRRGGGGKRRRKEEKPPLAWQTWAKANEQWLDDHDAAAGGGDEEGCGIPAPPAMAEPAGEVVLPLLRFQKEWLAWALEQEASASRGGILADEMGMGKTIQAISLVLTSRRLDPLPQLSPSQLRRVDCTLVVCPVVAVIQWAGEIERHTAKDSVRVLVYHGSRRRAATDFSEYDFVLTTYSTIEADYRKHIMPPKVRCEYCNHMLYPHKMKVHLRYYCGPGAQRTEKQAKQASKKKWGAAKKVKEVEGEGDSKKDDEEDGVSATSSSQARGKSPLHSVRWKRIILDEAHFIKDRRCNTARAVFALESEYKWALSGTPLQNRVGELYSLIRFLQIFPYSYYFCKDCDCKVLDTRLAKTCVNCDHSPVRHFCWWNKYISRPIQNGSTMDDGRRAMVLLRERVLKGIVLRRTKKGRAADFALPPKLVTLRRDSLDKNELEFYEALYTQSRTQFDSYVDAGTLMNNYAHIFDLLTRLRQAVDHPYLVVYSKTAELQGCKNDDDDEAIKSQCGICHLSAEDTVVTSCDHAFCKTCLIDYSASLGNVSCPSCSKPLTVDLTTKSSGEKVTSMAGKGVKRSGILSRLKSLAEFKTSTKIDALREEIRNMVENDGSAKGIVFSQFTSFLDLIHFSLERSGIKCVQLVGSMSLPERERVIAAFTDDPDCRIFLMGLKAGGVALNLTVASHVFLMDPWWNPAVESQAQDRIHRIGQYKPIRSVRFVIEDTIEERILKLQEKKELVFEGTVGDSVEAMSKLTEADLSEVARPMPHGVKIRVLGIERDGPAWTAWYREDRIGTRRHKQTQNSI